MKEIEISKNIYIKDFCKPYIIAEIGANHNGDIDLAKKLIDEAVNCGCDAVKFQSWTTNSVVSKQEYDNNQVYTDSKKKHFGSLREMVEKYYLTTEQHYELKAYCDSKKIEFCSTPFSNAEADLLDDIGVPFFKVASMDINNLDFLEYLAKKDKPIILSTGMSTVDEIADAVKVITNAGNDKIVLLHCISIYPPLMKDINLKNIEMLRSKFEFPVGFSDHTIGVSIPLASVALGSCVIEKHFTLDKNMPGWDHEVSADPTEMKIICEESKNIAHALGSFKRVVSKAELDKRIKFRRSAIAEIDMKKGYIIKEEDFSFKRPGDGIPPNNKEYLIGKKIKYPINKGSVIYKSNLN